jgi:GAF domain-containing protein
MASPSGATPSGLEKSVQTTFSAPVVLGTGEAGETLEFVLRALEVAGGDSFIVSILRIGAGGRTLHTLSAPSLPESYLRFIEGLPIGPDAGSCGSAAHFGHAVFVSDIASDARWTPYREAALAAGLRACWSTPVIDWRGRVVATFAVYHREPRSPTESEVHAIGLASAALAPLIGGARA